METPRSFWSALWQRPAGPRSLLGRYTVANGYLYLAIGAAIYLLPASALMRLFFLEHLTGYEPGLARAVGVGVAVIGWLYVMAGRTGAESFGLATVVDRMLIPVLLLPLWLLGMAPPGLILPFAILDPLLALGAYVIWRRERARHPG
jgi:hypothetical protein